MKNNPLDKGFQAKLDKFDRRVEEIFDVTNVEVKLLPGDYVELVHRHSNSRKVEKIPRNMTKDEDRAMFVQELASAFVRDVVKPRR